MAVPKVGQSLTQNKEGRSGTFLFMVVLVTSFNTGLSRTFFPKVVEREGPTPAPEPCLWCLLVAFSSALALAVPAVLFRIGSCTEDEVSIKVDREMGCRTYAVGEGRGHC